MRIAYGPHALANLADRKLEREWVERTILAPESQESDPNFPDRIRVYRPLPERDGRVLRVVYVRTDDGVRVVTMFLDRRRRRKP